MFHSEACQKIAALRTMKQGTGALWEFYLESIRERNQHEQIQSGTPSYSKSSRGVSNRTTLSPSGAVFALPGACRPIRVVHFRQE